MKSIYLFHNVGDRRGKVACVICYLSALDYIGVFAVQAESGKMRNK